MEQSLKRELEEDKKVKVEKSKASSSAESKEEDEEEEYEEEDEEEQQQKKKAKVKGSVSEKGDLVFDLNDRKKVTIGEYKGNLLVNIREFYEKDGKQLPGKTGIALTIDQYKVLADLVKDGSIDDAIKSKTKKTKGK